MPSTGQHRPDVGEGQHLAHPGQRNSLERHHVPVDAGIVLIPSAVLGPATWQPVSQILQRRGRRVRVPSLQPVARGSPPYWPAGVEAIVRSAGEAPVVLVPHSNAGRYVPAVIDALGEQVRGVVFVDAELPGAGGYSHRDALNALAGTDGRLPPWTSWSADAGSSTPRCVPGSRPSRGRMPLAYYDNLSYASPNQSRRTAAGPSRRARADRRGRTGRSTRLADDARAGPAPAHVGRPGHGRCGRAPTHRPAALS